MKNFHYKVPDIYPLGKPIPDSQHAISVSLPRWDHVIGYEENNPEVVSKIKQGYPRFVSHYLLNDLQKKFGLAETENIKFQLFPSLNAAGKCQQFLKTAELNSEVKKIDESGLSYIKYHPKDHLQVKSFQQHCGEIVSSRMAYDILNNNSLKFNKAKNKIRKKVAELSLVDKKHVFLFPTGMASIFSAFEYISCNNPGLPTIQYGFPYVDTLKIQTKMGSGNKLVPFGIHNLTNCLSNNNYSALFCEYPTNPLFQKPALGELYQKLKERDIPLIVDSTLDSFTDKNVIHNCDINVVSLSKYFSGNSDVMGGVLIINPKSRICNSILEWMENNYIDNLWESDANILLSNSDNFKERMEIVTKNSIKIVDKFSNNSKIEKFYITDMQDPAKSPGLFSIVLKNPEKTTETFYNSLKFLKGPSLGTNFTLVCSYTMLAHYNELNWAEKLGISRYLLRFSIGLEECGEIIENINLALDEI